MPGALEAVDGILAQARQRRRDRRQRPSSGCLGAQIALRNNRRLETAMRASRLPAVKTLEQFDFAFQPSIKREQIESLHELGFLAPQGERRSCWGHRASGKTHLAISLALAAAESGPPGLLRHAGEAWSSRWSRLVTAGPAGPSPTCADPSGAVARRRDRLPARQPRRCCAVLPTDQRAPRAGLDGADLQQGLRRMGRRCSGTRSWQRP